MHLKMYLAMFLFEILLIEVFCLQVFLGDFLIFEKYILNFSKQLIFFTNGLYIYIYIKVLFRSTIQQTLSYLSNMTKLLSKYDHLA